MPARYYCQRSIPYLFSLTIVFVLASLIRLCFEFKPTFTTSQNGQPINIPYLRIPNVGPIARSKWFKEVIGECVGFTNKSAKDVIDECSTSFFDIRTQDSFKGSLQRAPFTKAMLSTPNIPSEIQSVVTQDPVLIYEGSAFGMPIWRYQAVMITTRFWLDKYSSRRWVVDGTIAFEKPDLLHQSGFRFISFHMKELRLL